MNIASRYPEGKIKACCSDYMYAEEIAQEMARSGWNPYHGEEEIVQEMARSGWNPYHGEEEIVQEMARSEKDPYQKEGDSIQELTRDSTRNISEEMDAVVQPWDMTAVQPVFPGRSYEQAVEEQKHAERDLRSMQSMYPEAAKILLPHIEEVCDRMEYEGSMMFDRFPDQTTLYRMEEEIHQKVKDQFPDMQMQEAPDDVLAMHYPGHHRSRRRKNWLADMIRVLLLQEMHHRRCRHRNCRWNTY